MGKERKKLKEESKHEFQKGEENNGPMDYSEIYYWLKKINIKTLNPADFLKNWFLKIKNKCV